MRYKWSEMQKINSINSNIQQSRFTKNVNFILENYDTYTIDCNVQKKKKIKLKKIRDKK